MRLRAIGLVAAVSLAAPATAASDGLPVGNVDAGEAGVPSPRSHTRFVTRKVGQETRVAELAGPGGATVVRARVVRGRYTIPVVALDGTPGGLSADGGTLVLITPRRTFPRKRTTFTVLRARTLRVRTVLEFDGDYSFDALSPDGRWLYLVHYTARRDPTRYAVHAYDLRAGRMLPGPIVDPQEPDEAMRGYPLTRATTPNGRWEYTLYDGNGADPFIHALDTVGRTALCLDLDVLQGDSNLAQLRLRPRPGGKITVHYRGMPVAYVARESRRVSEPRWERAPVSPDMRRARRPEPLPGGIQAALIAFLGLAILAAATALAIGRRAPDSAAATPAGDDEHWYAAPR